MKSLENEDLSVFEVIYQQRLHSATQFENVQYNISNIINFVDEKNE